MMRGQGKLCKCLMSPLHSTVALNPADEKTTFFFYYNWGVQWLDMDGIYEMPSFFPDRVLGGLGVAIQEDIAELKNMITSGPNMEGAPYGDITVAIDPITETVQSYPQYMTAFPSKTMNTRWTAPTAINEAHHLSTGLGTILHLLGSDTVNQLDAEISSLVDSKFAQRYNFCPYVEKACTMHWNESSQAFTDKVTGTGPMHEPYMRDAQVNADVFNGKAKFFPSMIDSVASL